MRVFPHFPQNGHTVCPVCGTDEDGQTFLVPIHGTEDGPTVEAVPTHMHCILSNIRYSSEHKLMGLEANEEVDRASEV